MKVIKKKISQFWKSTKKIDFSLKKKLISEVISVVFFKPTNPKQKASTVAALIPWVSVFSPPKMGEKKKTAETAWSLGMGMENVEMAGNCFPVDIESLKLKTWDLLDDLEMPPEFVGGIFSC